MPDIVSGPDLERFLFRRLSITGVHRVLTRLPRRYDCHWLVNAAAPNAFFDLDEVRTALIALDAGLLARVKARFSRPASDVALDDLRREFSIAA